MAKPVLGRGLSALLGGVGSAAKPEPNVFKSPTAPAPSFTASVAEEQVHLLPVAKLTPCALQPRKDFAQEALQELAESIKQKGIVQPLIVRKRGEVFELIAGERRWRAAQMCGIKEIPAIIREADDRTVLELALIENLQRENLNPIEEALGYSQLINQFQITQEEAAAKVGKSRALVANSMRLLKLAPDLQAYVRDGRLSVGHAKVILALSNWEEQKLAAERILRKSLNVRQTEELVSFLQAKPDPKTSRTVQSVVSTDTHLADLTQKLQQRFGTKVQIRYRKGKGSVEIKFFTDDDLERILKITGIDLES